MNRVLLGLICGLAFGIIDIVPMYITAFPTAAILGAFFSRFAIGFIICNVRLPLPWWLSGLIVSLLISLPDAIITEAYIPILGSGVLGGLVIGWISGRFGAAIAAK